MAVLYDRSVTFGGPRRGDGQQDRVADRLHDVVRRLRLRLQPDRGSVQEPGPPAGRGDRRAGRDRAQGPEAPTCGRARRTRTREGSATRSSTGSSSGGSTSAARSRRWSRWASMPPRSSAWTGWSRAPSSSGRSRRSPSSAADDRGGLPLPTSPARLDTRLTRADAEGAATRRADPAAGGTLYMLRPRDRQPGRRDHPGARDPARGPADRRRGHPPHPPPARTPRHSDAMTSYHARSGPARTVALLDHLRGGADLALVTDAGTPDRQRSRRGARGGLGGGGRRRRARAGRLGGPGRGRRFGRCRSALGVRGLSAPTGPRASRASCPDRGRRPRHGAVRGTRARGRHPRRPGRGLRARIDPAPSAAS